MADWLERVTEMGGPFRWEETGLAGGVPAGSDAVGAGRSLGFLQAFFENCPLGLFACADDDGRLLAVNREFARLVGYSREECLGLSFSDLVAPEDMERIREFRSRRLRRDPTLPNSYEVLLARRSGERWVALFNANWVPFADVLFGSLQDITSEKVGAESVVHLQRMESLATLAGGLAGEFNNLLGAISGYADLAVSQAGATMESAAPLRRIQAAAAQAHSHVHSLLSFARSGANAFQTVDLDGLLGGLLAVLPAAAGRPLQVELAPGPPLGAVRGDGSQLELALLNILLNAAEAAPRSGGRVTLSKEQVHLRAGERENLAPGVYALLAVEDNGPGVPPAVRPRLFQPFFTTKNATRHPGLGLSTSFGLIRDHGGAVWFEERTAGPGSRFVVLLPRASEPRDLLPVPLTPARAGSSGPILVVDDQPLMAELFGDLLEAAGYRVTRMTSAVAALDLLAEGRLIPSLIIVDLMMPDLDGRSFIRRLGELGVDAPVLVTSGYARPEEGDMELGTACCGFIRKPIDRERLLALVGQVLGGGGASSPEVGGG